MYGAAVAQHLDAVDPARRGVHRAYLGRVRLAWWITGLEVTIRGVALGRWLADGVWWVLSGVMVSLLYPQTPNPGVPLLALIPVAPLWFVRGKVSGRAARQRAVLERWAREVETPRSPAV